MCQTNEPGRTPDGEAARQAAIAALQAAVDAGRASGPAVAFDRAAFLARMGRR